MKTLRRIGLACCIILLTPVILHSQDIVIEDVIPVGADLSSLGYPAGWTDPLSHDIKITPDGKKAYILSGGYTRNLYVVDLTLRTLSNTISFNSGIWRMMGFSKDGSKLFISTSPPAAITVFSTTTDSVIATIPVSPYTWCFNFELSPDGSKMYVMTVPDRDSYWQRSRLLIIDMATLTIESSIDMADTSAVIDFRAWKVTPDGRYLLYGSAGSVIGPNWQVGYLTVIDLSIKQTVAKIRVTDTTATYYGANSYGVKDIAVSNGKAYVANYETSDITVVDISTMQAIRRIAIGGRVFSLRTQAGTNYIWALARGTDKVAIIDTTSDTIFKETGLSGLASYIDDRHPLYETPLLSGIDFTSDGKLVVVTSSNSGLIALLDGNNKNATFGDIIKTLETGNYPSGIKVAGKTAYVVMGSELVVCDIKGGTVTLEEAITDVASSLSALISTTPTLQKAIDDLYGSNGGSANNGAIDKLNEGNIVAALEMIKKAIKDLQSTQSDTFSLQQTLAIGAAGDTETFIKQMESKAGSGNSLIIAAWNLYNTGLRYWEANDFITAVDYFKKAVAKALDTGL